MSRASANRQELELLYEQYATYVQGVRECQERERKQPELKEFEEKKKLFYKKTTVEVTDMNEFVESLQSFLIGQQSDQADIVGELGQVYGALDTIDEIHQLELRETSSKITSKVKGVKQHFEKLFQGVKGRIQSHDESIDDIDGKVLLQEKNIENLNERVMHDAEEIEKNKECLERVAEYVEWLNSFDHLKDVDTEWEYSHSLGEEIERLSTKITDGNVVMEELRSKLSLLESKNAELIGKVRVAFLVAGGALGLSIIVIILSLVGIL